MILLIPTVVIIVLILLNALFVAAEFAIIGVRPSRLEQLVQAGNKTATRIRDIVRHPGRQDRYIATAQLGITLASVGLGMYGEPAIAHVLEEPLHDWFGLESALAHSVAFVIALALLTYLHVVVGEMVPKSLALTNPERTVLALAGPMALVERLFSFAVTALNQLGLLVLRLLRVPPPSAGSRLHTADELELIVSESASGGLLSEESEALVGRIFDFPNLRVGALMTPRPQIEAIPVTISEETLVAMVGTRGYRRLPVYEGTIDTIIGVLHLRDLIAQQVQGPPFDLRALLRPAPMVSEGASATALLATLQSQRLHLAVVMDEYGGSAGVISLDDLFEAVVGPIRDQVNESAEVPLVVVGAGLLRVQGDLPWAALAPYVPVDGAAVAVQTIGGVVMAHLGRVPVVGDEVMIAGATFEVEAVEGRRITRLAVRVPADPLLPSRGGDHG